MPAEEAEGFEMPESRKPNVPLLCVLLVLLSAMLPMAILFASNLGIRLSEILLPIGILVVVSALVFIVLRLLLKMSLAAALCTAVIMLLVMNFHLLRSLFDLFLNASAAVYAAFGLWMLLLGVLLYLVLKRRSSQYLPQISQILCIVMAVLMLFNVVRVVPRVVNRAQLMGMASQSPETMPAYVSAEEMHAHTVDGNGRNFYWIMLDEYADPYTMDTYFGADPSPFVSFLQEKGFSVSSSSHSNSNNSFLCTVDAVSLSYFSSDAVPLQEAEKTAQIEQEGDVLRRTGALYAALHELGYSVYQVSSHTDHYPVVKELLPQTLREKLLVSTTVDGLSVLDIAREMSVLSVITTMTQGEGDDDSLSARMFNASFRARVLRVFDYYDDPKNLCFKDRTALFTYVLCPHTPFVFSADGGSVSSKSRRDWEDPSHYAEQHAYMTTRAESMIESILSVDPDAVILLQSDHGVRGGFFVGHGLQVELEDQRRIFNALYFGGESVDIDGLSAVNTLRYALTRLGADYPMLSEEGIRPFYYKEQIGTE